MFRFFQKGFIYFQLRLGCGTGVNEVSMATFHYSFRATLASIAILSGAALSITFLIHTFTDSATAAKKNFAAKCERAYGDISAKALAIEETLSYQQVCVCARTNRTLRRKLGAAGIKCNNSQLTNFNEAPRALGPGPDPGPSPGPDPDPGPLKGNNGWGNGAEGINSGSFTGKTADSKSTDRNGTGVR